MALTVEVPRPVTVVVAGREPTGCGLTEALTLGGRVKLLGSVPLSNARAAVSRLRPQVVLVWLSGRSDGSRALLRELCGLASVVTLLRPGSERLVAELSRAGVTGCLVHGDFSPAELVNAVLDAAVGRTCLSPLAATALFGQLRTTPSLTLSAKELVRNLSTVDRRLLGLVARGIGDNALAAFLGQPVPELRHRLGELYRALGVRNREEAAELARRAATPGPALTTLSSAWRTGRFATP